MGIHAITNINHMSFTQFAQVSQVVTLYHPSRQTAKTAYNSPLDPFQRGHFTEFQLFRSSEDFSERIQHIQLTPFLFKYIDWLCVYLCLSLSLYIYLYTWIQVYIQTTHSSRQIMHLDLQKKQCTAVGRKVQLFFFMVVLKGRTSAYYIEWTNFCLLDV